MPRIAISNTPAARPVDAPTPAQATRAGKKPVPAITAAGPIIIQPAAPVDAFRILDGLACEADAREASQQIARLCANTAATVGAHTPEGRAAIASALTDALGGILAHAPAWRAAIARAYGADEAKNRANLACNALTRKINSGLRKRAAHLFCVRNFESGTVFVGAHTGEAGPRGDGFFPMPSAARRVGIQAAAWKSAVTGAFSRIQADVEKEAAAEQAAADKRKAGKKPADARPDAPLPQPPADVAGHNAHKAAAFVVDTLTSGEGLAGITDDQLRALIKGATAALKARARAALTKAKPAIAA
jgi:hypothetical protein